MASNSSYVWALHELGLANFNDTRLAKRGVLLAASLLEHPQSSIPQSCGDWAGTKGAYRFLGNNKVRSNKMLESHQEQLRHRAEGCETALVAQDTCTFNLSNRQVSGLGSIGDGKDESLQGLFAHTGLAMDTDGLPLGLTSQKIYTRKAETKTEAYRKTIKNKPISEKETYRWVEAVNQAKAVLPDKKLVIIGDRESDIYEVFEQGKQIGVDLLVRASQNRKLPSTTKEDPDKLFDVAPKGNVITTYEADIPIDNHKFRKVLLTIRLTSFSLLPPKSRDRDKVRPSIPLTLLHVSEETPENGVEPIKWLLTTSLTVTTPEEAIEKVRWYTYRWRIERFHYILKTGAFNIEKLQFESFSRFAKAITLYSLVAIRVLWTVYYERAHPDQDAQALFSSSEVEALCLREESNSQALTCHQAVVALAKIGGYLNRTSDASPGIKALWIGFQALQYIVEGIRIGRNHPKV
jgi:hypothetical protein